jgi:anti-sigma B factor antagonist
MQPITSTASESGTLVRVAVRLDAEGCEPLAQEFDRLLRAGEHRVALDLTDVAFMSSAGLGAIVAAARRFAAIGGRLEVVAASEPVRAILRLTRVDTLVGPTAGGAGGRPATATRAAPAAPEADRTVAGVRFTALRSPQGPPLAARCVTGGFAGAGSAATVLSVSPQSFALGLGTPDGDHPQPAAVTGELVVAAGAAFHRPPAVDPRIDYVIPVAGSSPPAAVVSGLAWEGEPSGKAAFTAAGDAAAVAVDDLALALLGIAGGGPLGFVAVGEIHGLVGAELVRPLVEATAGDEPLGGGGAATARWLSFSREPVHAGRTAVVVGVVAAARPVDPACAAGLRPLRAGEPAGPQGHLHAVIFPFRPIPREPGRVADLVATLAATPPLAVMHLLADPLPILGSGRSELVRGCVWFAPLAFPAEQTA